MRIGVITDTHVGEHLPEVPEEALRALEGVDLVIHAGDLSLPGVVRRLREVAPVVAVRGNHDDDGGGHGLPAMAWVRAGEVTIAVSHGLRPRLSEQLHGAAVLLARDLRAMRFERAMLRRARGADVIVTGHTHIPVERRANGTLLFSPGAVYVPECDPWFDWSTAGARLYRSFRRLVPEEARQPAVGVLEVDGRRVRARRILLHEPLRGRARARVG